MEQLVKELEAFLLIELEALVSEKDVLRRKYLSVEASRSAILQLRSYITDHPFADQATEIHYFKKTAPSFYARLFYNHKIYNLELERKYASRERQEQLLVRELEVVEEFFERHQDFVRYIYQQDSYNDERIFIRDQAENAMLDELEVIMGNDFCVGCYWSARLQANELLQAYLGQELKQLRDPDAGGASGEPSLKWTGSHTDLVELIYGLYLTGCFNEGRADIKEIVKWFEENTQVELGNYYVTWQEIGRRKKSGAKFVGEMKVRLERRMEGE